MLVPAPCSAVDGEKMCGVRVGAVRKKPLMILVKGHLTGVWTWISSSLRSREPETALLRLPHKGFATLGRRSFLPHLQGVGIQKGTVMNLYEQLLVVRTRLEGIGAHDDSMDLVEMLLKKAEPARRDRTSISQVQVLRHMLRMPEVVDNYSVYNDLQELISERDETEIAAREDSAPAAYEDTERHPKPKSYYKAKKEKEKKRG